MIFMTNNKIFSKEISPCKILKKDHCIVWVFLKNRKTHWIKVLFSSNGFHYCGVDITHKVVAWTPLTKKEIQSDKGVKVLTKKEKVLIPSICQSEEK